MSRARKPIAAQKGNLTTEAKAKKEREQALATGNKNFLKKPPIFLINSVAKKEYVRLAEELSKIDMIGNLDINNIAAYSNAYAMYRKATQKIAKLGDLAPEGVESTYINIQKKYADEMRKFGALCGLSIDSRLKLASISREKEEKEIEGEFGDI